MNIQFNHIQKKKKNNNKQLISSFNIKDKL